MIEDHERIEELLAGYALLALGDEDATEADRLLAEHVPTCLTCRRTMDAFREVTGDLALEPSPVPTPDLLLPRIHRAIDDVPQRSRSRFGVAWAAAAASVVALVAMGGVSLTMAGRANEAERRGQIAADALVNAANTGAVTIDGIGSSADSDFVEVVGPDVKTLHLVANDCPQPAPGMVYELWLGRDGHFVPYGRFRPNDSGFVALEVSVDVSRFDEIAITEEIEGSSPSEPNLDGARTWRATIAS